MKTTSNGIPEKNITKRLGMWALVVAGVLMIPFLTQAPWTGSDFIFAGIVLFGSAIVYELATKTMTNKTHRIAVAAGVIAFLVVVQAWAAA